MTSRDKTLNEYMKFIKIHNMLHKEKPISQLTALKVYLESKKSA